MVNHSYKQQYQEQGYVVVRNLLTKEEVKYYIDKLESLSGITRQNYQDIRRNVSSKRGQNELWEMQDGVSVTPDFWQLIFHERLLSIVREILGEKICYLQHSDLHVGFSDFAWHRDNVNRILNEGSDWDESDTPYRLLRCAVYLQSYKESHFKLGFIPGTHRAKSNVSFMTKLSESYVKMIRRLSFADPSLQRWVTNAVWIATEPGDCILFDPRLIHSGGYIIGPKYSMIVAYGLENKHFYNHYNYYRHIRKELGYENLSPELTQRLKDADLHPQKLPVYDHIPNACIP